MATSFMQKIRLWLRGWNRRREEKLQEFLEKESVRPSRSDRPVPPVTLVDTQDDRQVRPGRPLSVDMDGLQAAYFDGSGQIAYYLDVESGEVVEQRAGEPLDATRYKRVPAMSNNDIGERRAFIDTLDPSPTRDLLMKSVNTPAFRTALASDRATERAWYNFRNDRAIAAIDSWLKKLGVR